MNQTSNNAATFETQWERYAPRLRQTLFDQGAEPEAMDEIIGSQLPIFQHYCQRLTINPKDKAETVAMIEEWISQQIIGLLVQIALRDLIIWRLMRGLPVAGESAAAAKH